MLVLGIVPGLVGGEKEKKPEKLLAVAGDGEKRLPFYERPMTLFDKSGRETEAMLLSANGETISIERTADGKRFEVPLETFDERSQRSIEIWMDRDPEAVQYAIGYEVQKRVLDSNSFESRSTTTKRSQWVYDVVVTNLSRNELTDVELEFQIVYEDKVNMLRTTAMQGEGRMHEGSSVQLPPLKFNGRAELTTPPVVLDAYEYDPTRGEREYFRDQLVGIWIRLVKGGRIISEYKSNDVTMKNEVWGGMESYKIEVKDSFKDNFDKE